MRSLAVSASTDAFLAAAARSEAEPGLEAALADAHARAQAALPLLEIAAERFAGFLGAKVDPEETSLEALARLHIEDLYLALGCALGATPALQWFVGQQLGQVPRYVGRLSRNPALAEEVQQELARRLLVSDAPELRRLPRIASYNGRGPLDSWVAVSAQRTALTMLQRQRTGVPDATAELERVLTASPDPELQVARAHLKENFEWAMRTALRALSPRDRLLLRLSVVSGLSCRKLGVMHGVHAATAARWMERIRDEIFASIQRTLRDRQGIDPADLPSLLGLVRSRLELSLSGLLDDGGEVATR
jgi:RNA polymerase sigma-70 factor, ECF subfamily